MRLNSESIETILERFDRRDDADADYVMAHWRESVDVYEHDGSMLDLDCLWSNKRVRRHHQI